MNLWGEVLSTGSVFFLFLALGLALAFEFVNGFHDTANAVATVIYTNTLKPTVAVVWSGIWNLIGVLTSSGAVAYGIIALLPVELVINVGTWAGFAMVFALLLSAIIWNLGTWYLGLPASSSHTLIGSIIGVGLANSILSKTQTFGEGVNWLKARDIGLSLIVSPLVGFCVAGLLLLLCKKLIRRPDLYSAPEKGKVPPLWIRALLVLTCTGVSFAHGSNDGQKGMGLVMLILIGIVPGAFALKMNADKLTLREIASSARQATAIVQPQAGLETATKEEATARLSSYLKGKEPFSPKVCAAIVTINQSIAARVGPLANFQAITEMERRALRSDFYLIEESIGKISKSTNPFSAPELERLATYKKRLDALTKYLPDWVKYAVALALGLGTMIGWKRIVVTVGEKIGKGHLTYAQGASAELVAMATIAAADRYGLPVSTTHVLSSGIAGTMAANHSGLQMQTLRNVLLAWVLTLPACVFLGATFFSGTLYIILDVLGLK